MAGLRYIVAKYISLSSHYYSNIGFGTGWPLPTNLLLHLIPGFSHYPAKNRFVKKVHFINRLSKTSHCSNFYIYQEIVLLSDLKEIE